MHKKQPPVESIKRQIQADGFTTFAVATEKRLLYLEEGSAEHAILYYLMKHAMGVENAKNWDEIDAHLKTMGIHISKNRFQMKILQDSRSSRHYIGSCSKGFFIFKDSSDVTHTIDFYEKRIAKELRNLEALRYLAGRAQFD